MSTLNDIRSLVLQAVARDDSVASTIATAAINYAITMASLTFEPAEMFKKSSFPLTGGSNVVHFPNLVDDEVDEATYMGLMELDANGDVMPIDGSTINTRLLDLVAVYNTTGGTKLNFVPYESWEIVIPSGLEDLKYWTMFGTAMYLKATPTTTQQLTVSYSTYPAVLTEDNNALPFDHHDSYITSTATGICWAAFEEGEPSMMWNQIANLVGDPSALGTKARAIIEGQRARLEAAISQGQGG